MTTKTAIGNQALALLGTTQHPDYAITNLPSPGVEQREAIFRVLASVANAGAGYNITLGVDQAKVIARVMLDHDKMLREVADLSREIIELRTVLANRRKRR